MKEQVIYLLRRMYDQKFEELSYEGIDEFYAEIGYDLESEGLLRELGLSGTSDFMELLREEGDIEKEEREIKFSMKKRMYDFLSKTESDFNRALINIVDCKKKEHGSKLDALDVDLIGELMNNYIDVYNLHNTMNPKHFFDNQMDAQINFVLDPNNVEVVAECYFKMREDFVDSYEEETSGDNAAYFEELLSKYI